MLGAAAMREGKTRIDCYKGIAHKLPDDHEPEDRGGDRGPPTKRPWHFDHRQGGPFASAVCLLQTRVHRRPYPVKGQWPAG